jgi:hypothetical protein
MVVEESNVVFLSDHREISPILSRGDLVTIMSNGLDGLVVGVTSIFGPDSNAPGQASTVDIAVPTDENWEVFEDVSIHEIRRIISKEYQLSRGVDTETG